MINREKIIKGLGHCINEEDCRGCVYYDDYCNKLKERHNGNKCPCFLDAVALLKEQELVCVYETKNSKCVCGNIINRYYHPKFCGYCGKELMWY